MSCPGDDRQPKERQQIVAARGLECVAEHGGQIGNIGPKIRRAIQLLQRDRLEQHVFAGPAQGGSQLDCAVFYCCRRSQFLDLARLIGRLSQPFSKSGNPTFADITGPNPLVLKRFDTPENVIEPGSDCVRRRLGGAMGDEIVGNDGCNQRIAPINCLTASRAIARTTATGEKQSI